MTAREPIAIDTETTGLDWHSSSFRVRLVQFGDNRQGFAVPIEWYWGLVREALSLVQGSTEVIFHNAPYDMHALHAAGLPLPRWADVHDTRILAHLRSPATRHGLKALGVKHFGRWAAAGQTALAGLKRAGYDWATFPVDADAYWAYGVMDTILTRMLYDELTPAPPRYDDVMGYVSVMWRAEERGLTLDTEAVDALASEWSFERLGLKEKLKEHGITNPNANRQIENLLVQAGWEPTFFTDKSGDAKLDKEVLAPLAAEYPWVSDLLEYKKLTKWLTSYVNPMKGNEVVHPHIKALGAVTGRTSVSNPPFHQLPSHDHRVRGLVVPRAGHLLCAIDYRSEEPRIMAQYMGPGSFSQAFAEWGDPYLAYANAVEPGNESALRSAMKPVQLGISYGAGPATVAKSMGTNEATAKAFLKRIYTAYPEIPRWIDDVQAQVARRYRDEGQGYVTTLAGRRIPVPSDEAYKGVNYICQGSGADVMHDAVNRLNAAGLGDNILLDVHDEILFQFPEESFDECRRLAVSCMERPDLEPLPLLVDASEAATDWSQTK